MSDLVGNPEDRFSQNKAQLYSDISCCKNGYFQMKNLDIFLIFAQNIDRGYTLEPPHWL